MLNVLCDGESTKNLLIAGIDEAGRGPLCGDVYAAAVILDPNKPIAGLNDSKKLSEKKRERLALDIKMHAFAWSIASANVAEIDELNILRATFLAMKRAIKTLSVQPEHIYIDGNQDPKLNYATTLVVKGDSLYAEIAAASILAKTARDRAMIELDLLYPQYGFAKHKGYGTKAHQMALMKYGVTPYHRKSFSPISRIIAKEKQTII